MYSVPSELFSVARALGEQTRFHIFRFIAESEGPVSVQHLVDEFSMHHSAIRSHLAKLQEAGLLNVEREREEGAVGRPRLAFTPCTEQHSVSIPPRQYRLLAELALAYALSRTEGWEEVEEFGRTWGTEHARQIDGRRNQDLTPGDALKLLLRDLPLFDGFNASSDEEGTRYVLVGTNCPFAELAERYDPLTCTLHSNAIRGALEELIGRGMTWSRVSRMAEGDPACVLCAEDPPITRPPVAAGDSGGTV